MTKNFTLAENITTENGQNFIVNREVPAYKMTFRTANSNEVKKRYEIIFVSTLGIIIIQLTHDSKFL